MFATIKRRLKKRRLWKGYCTRYYGSVMNDYGWVFPDACNYCGVKMPCLECKEIVELGYMEEFKRRTGGRHD